MSFLDSMADCESCPTPHNICEASWCTMCGSCPTARARREELATERAAYEASTAQARHRG